VALVIGRRARRVSPADGWDHVAAVTAADDFGVYDPRYAAPTVPPVTATVSPTPARSGTMWH
jgi:hypothetical protein